MSASQKNPRFISIKETFLQLTIAFGLIWFGFSSDDNDNANYHKVATPSETAIQATLRMETGINHSLIALENWMLLGKEEFKAQRVNIWKNEIEPSFKQIKAYSDHWYSSSQDVIKLGKLEKKLNLFKEYQNKIEKVARNGAAFDGKVIFTKATPSANLIIKDITNMIELEKKRHATEERKNVFVAMADFRGSMSMCFESISMYLLTRDPEFKKQYQTYWDKNEESFTFIQANADLLKPEQKKAFEDLKLLRDNFTNIPGKIFSLKDEAKPKQAQVWLNNKVNPTAKEIKYQLREIIDHQII